MPVFSKAIVYGNVATALGKAAVDDAHTHSWTLYLRSAHGEVRAVVRVFKRGSRLGLHGCILRRYNNLARHSPLYPSSLFRLQDLSHVFGRVSFQLHESFARPVRGQGIVVHQSIQVGLYRN